MPSLVYVPVSTLHNTASSSEMLTLLLLGFCPPGGGDGHLHAAHRPTAIHPEAQAFHLHFRKPNSSEIPIWHEGEKLCRNFKIFTAEWARLRLSSF